MTRPSDIIAFWDGVGPEAWYKQSDTFDAEIRDRFLPTWEDACAGGARDWMDSGPGCLARLIVLDQFPRNLFRNDPRAYCTDGLALQTARHMIDAGWDVEVDGLMRQFVYMPFMHSEALADQDTCVALMEARMTEGNNALHARVHREIVMRYGRFPYRDGPLGRDTTPEEAAFLDGGGYGAIVQELEAVEG